MTLSLLEQLPKECFNTVGGYLSIRDLALGVGMCSQQLNICCGQGNSELWNGLLCDRMWTVDPGKVLSIRLGAENDTANTANNITNWKEQYSEMVTAETEYRAYLENLKSMNLEGWLERHFIGDLALAQVWNGWERRFWTWDSDSNSFSAWEDDTLRIRYAVFPVTSDCEVCRVPPEDQLKITSEFHSNPIRETRQHVFTLSNTSLPLLWACEDEEQLQLWLDKIAVTLHPLKFGGRQFQAPAQYRLFEPKKPTL